MRRSSPFLPCVLATLSLAVGAPSGAQVPRCGVERWPVKVLADPDVATIDWSPVPTSIPDLRSRNRPDGALPQHGRRGDEERAVFRVRAVVRQVIVEDDGDWHVVLADPGDPSATMVAEVPDSACALGTGFETRFADVRRALRAVPRDGFVEVEGVGFFDFLHGQRGMAPNGLELHPLLAARPAETRWGPSLPPARGATASPGRASDTGRRGLPAPPARPAGPPFRGPSPSAQRVWLNTRSGVYHCPGSPYFGTTAHGEFRLEAEALREGRRPANGRRCHA